MKKHTISIAFLLLLTLILSSCTSTDDDLIEGLNKQIETLEEHINGSNNAISDLEDMQGQLLEDIGMIQEQADTLQAENDDLVASLEETNELLVATEAAAAELPDPDPIPAAISPYPGMSVMAASLEVLDAMRTGDFVTLSTYIDPMNPVKFSPFQNLHIPSMFFLTDAQVAILPTLPTPYPWGTHPASGDIITLTPLDYFNQYVYDEDYYLAPIVGMNNIVSSGNMINNIESTFPTADYVEFLYPGFDPSYNGLDWSSITLVFTTDSGMPMLIAIVHGEYTP